ncbi:MAG: MobA/MobL protein, partial [Finegoldia magna]|nr:MobA/MobL protein [Finegoldia magna]
FELANQSKKISSDIQEKTQRIKDLNQCVSCIDSIKENKKVYQEYKSKTIFKDSFYNSHKKEIDKYQRARKTIEKFTGTSAIKLNDWQKEITKLEKKIEVLNKDKIKIQDEFKQIDHIKYAVKIVNDEYGIDLSIEIDKAIKRGEKPSVIAQLKKFQEQQEKRDQYRQKAKEKYTEQER